MTILQYIDNGFLILGAALIAIVVMRAFWYLTHYTFFGGDDAERSHAKEKLLFSTISLMFIMLFWPLIAWFGLALHV